MQQFDSRRPVEILQDIFLLKKRKDKGEKIDLPLLTIILPNKLPLSGFLQDFKKESNEGYQLSMEMEGSADLLITETYYIQGVIIHEVGRIDYLLKEIKSENAGERNISKLDLKNSLAEETKRLSAWFNKSIEFKIEDELTDIKSFYFLKNLVIDISMTLLSIGEEEPGKSTITESIDQVILKKGSDLQTAVESRALTITDTFARSYSTNVQRANLHQAILNVL